MVYRYIIWGDIDVLERQKPSRKFNVPCNLEFYVVVKGRYACLYYPETVKPGRSGNQETRKPGNQETRKPGISEIKELRNCWGMGFCKLKKIGEPETLGTCKLRKSRSLGVRYVSLIVRIRYLQRSRPGYGGANKRNVTLLFVF